MKSSSFWLNFFLVCAGIVLDALLTEITAGTPGLEWLNFGLTFGTEEPLILNLAILRLTLGMTFKLTISTAICVSFMLLLGRLIALR